jgi:hypothetical protein
MSARPKNISYSKKICVRRAPLAQNDRLQKKNVVASILARLYSYINSPTKLLSFIILVISTIVITFTLVTKNIFIDDVVFEGEAAGKGEIGQKLLERAIALKDRNFEQRKENLNEPSFLSIKENSSSEAKPSRSCNLTVDLAADGTIFRSSYRGTEMSARALDAVVAKDSISLRKFAFQIREMVGWKARELSPVLSFASGEYVLTLHSSPPAGEPKKIKFVNFDEASTYLSAAIVDYLSPELPASEDLRAGQRDFSDHHAIAKKFLDDHQKSLLILYLQTIADFERRGRRSDLAQVLSRIVPVTRLLISKMDFNLYGAHGPIIKYFLYSRLVLFEVIKSRYNGTHLSPDESFLTYIAPLADDLRKSRSGSAVLALSYINHQKFDEFFDMFNKLMGRPDEKGISNIDLFLLYADAVIKENPKFVRRLISTEFANNYEKGISPYKLRSERDAAFAAVFAIADLIDGDAQRFNRLEEMDFSKNTCAVLMLANHVHQFLEAGLLIQKNAKPVIERIASWFPRLEEAGLRNREFYEIWAQFSIYTGDAGRAVDLYDKSNEYDGDRAWGLLNAGSAALIAKDFGKAKERYAESLAIADIPKAVHGILLAHRELGDDEKYLDAYDRYFDGISLLDHIQRVEIEVNARLASCRLKREFKASIMQDGEKLADSSANDRTIIIDTETCSYRLQELLQNSSRRERAGRDGNAGDETYHGHRERQPDEVGAASIPNAKREARAP